MSHEPYGLLRGIFRGSQQRRVTVNKKGFAIVSTFRWLECLLWGGLHIIAIEMNQLDKSAAD